MKVYVNGEEKKLTLIDRASGKEYATMILCSQERLDKDEYGNFTLTEEEYKDWQDVLAVFQEAEDIRFSLAGKVEEAELDDYLYEETKYLTSVRSTAETERIILKELQKALTEQDTAWLLENHFPKTVENKLAHP